MPRKLATLDEDGNLVPFRYGGGTPNRPASDTVICMTFDMEGNEIPMPFFGGTEGGIIPEVVSQIAQIPLNTAARIPIVNTFDELPENPVDGLHYRVLEGGVTMTQGSMPLFGADPAPAYINMRGPLDEVSSAFMFEGTLDGISETKRSWLYAFLLNAQDALGSQTTYTGPLILVEQQDGSLSGNTVRIYLALEDGGVYNDTILVKNVIYKEAWEGRPPIPINVYSGQITVPDFEWTGENAGPAMGRVSDSPWVYVMQTYMSDKGRWLPTANTTQPVSRQIFSYPRPTESGSAMTRSFMDFSILLYQAGIFTPPTWWQVTEMNLYQVTDEMFQGIFVIPAGTPNDLLSVTTAMNLIAQSLSDETEQITIQTHVYTPETKNWSGLMRMTNLETGEVYEEPFGRNNITLIFEED